MEERHDGDSVELIDYVRTIWWGKWIILGCLVVAVGLSLLFASLRPTTHSDSTEFLLREHVTAVLPGNPATATVMASAVGTALTEIEAAVPGIEARLANDRITLSRSNATSTQVVSEALSQAETLLEQQLQLALTEELERLTQVAVIKRSYLTAQLEILLERLSEEQAAAGVPLSEALAERIAGLEVQSAQVLAHLDTLGTTDPQDLFILTQISAPTINASRSNSMNRIAIAGFLGLMLGVLMAFFLRYLFEVQARERRSAENKRR